MDILDSKFNHSIKNPFLKLEIGIEGDEASLCSRI